MSKVLEIVQPEFKFTTFEESLLSVVQNNERVLNYTILSNFIHIMTNIDYCDDPDLAFCGLNSFYQYEGIQSGDIPMAAIQKGYDFISFIRQLIDSGYYLILAGDTYNLPNNCNYKIYHRYHEIFVYGYDDGGVYVKSYFDYTQFTSAYVRNNDLEMFVFERNVGDFYEYRGRHIYFKINDWFIRQPIIFEMNRLKSALIKFLDGTVIHDFNQYLVESPHEFVFGMQIFNKLREMICKRAEEKVGNVHIKGFYMLYTHQSIMKKRLDILSKKVDLDVDIINKLTKTIKMSRGLYQQIVRNNIRNDWLANYKLLSLIDDIERQYRNTIHDILSMTNVHETITI